jgi:hypothetical protein
MVLDEDSHFSGYPVFLLTGGDRRLRDASLALVHGQAIPIRPSIAPRISSHERSPSSSRSRTGSRTSTGSRT